MKVELIEYTNNAKELLILSKNTRHMSEPGAFESVKDMSGDKKSEEIKYVFGTIGSSWEFVNYVFLVTGVTRGFTHQLVRSRHASYAQQSLRIVDIGDFEYVAEGTAKNNDKYKEVMKFIADGYREMVDDGVNIQDARGVLPTNIKTNILVSANLRTLADMISARACVRTQGEYQNFTELAKHEIMSVHPWIDEIIFDVSCIRNNLCPWKNFKECPMKIKFPHLDGPSDDLVLGMRTYFKGMSGFSPQPKKVK